MSLKSNLLDPEMEKLVEGVVRTSSFLRTLNTIKLGSFDLTTRVDPVVRYSLIPRVGRWINRRKA